MAGYGQRGHHLPYAFCLLYANGIPKYFRAYKRLSLQVVFLVQIYYALLGLAQPAIRHVFITVIMTVDSIFIISYLGLCLCTCFSFSLSFYECSNYVRLYSVSISKLVLFLVLSYQQCVFSV